MPRSEHEVYHCSGVALCSLALSPSQVTLQLCFVGSVLTDGVVPDEMLQAVKVAFESMALMLQVSGLPLKCCSSIGTSTHSCGSPHQVSKLVKINVQYCP